MTINAVRIVVTFESAWGALQKQVVLHTTNRAPAMSVHKCGSADWRGRMAAVLILSALPTFGNAQTFRDALAHAYQTSPKLLAEQANLRAADESVPQAEANWRPTVQVTGSAGIAHDDVTGGTAQQDQFLSTQYPTRSYGLSVTQPIYRGGRTVAQTKQALNSVRSEAANLAQTEEDILLQAITDYLDVVRDQALLALAIDNENVLRAQLDAGQAKYIGGEQSRADVAASTAAYNEAIAQRMQAGINLAGSQLNFQRDIGLTPGSLMLPADLSAPAMTRDEAEQVALRDNPKLSAARFTELAAEASVDLTFGQALPNIAIVGTVRHQEDASFIGERETIAAVSVQLTVPLYSGGLVESQTRAAKQTVERRRHEIDLAVEDTISETNSAWIQAETLRHGVRAYEAQIAANEVSLEGVQQQQMAGERTILDVLNVEHNLFQSRVNLIQTQHDWLLANYRLMASLGRLTARNLGLNVERYDPDRYLDAVKNKWFGFGVPK